MQLFASATLSLVLATSLAGPARGVAGVDEQVDAAMDVEVETGADAGADAVADADAGVPREVAIAAADGSVVSWQVAPAGTLEEMRGAFDFASGLHLAIGVERSVYMNGELVARTSSTLGDLPGPSTGAAGTPGVAVNADALGGSIALIRQGAGNTGQFDALLPGTAATLIQNSLNDRAIAVVTTIDAATNSMQLLRSLNLQAALKDAVNLPLASGR